MKTIDFKESIYYDELDKRINKLENAVKELVEREKIKEMLNQNQPITLDNASNINIEAKNVYYDYTDSKELKEQDNE